MSTGKNIAIGVSVYLVLSAVASYFMHRKMMKDLENIGNNFKMPDIKSEVDNIFKDFNIKTKYDTNLDDVVKARIIRKLSECKTLDDALKTARDNGWTVLSVTDVFYTLTKDGLKVSLLVNGDGFTAIAA